MLFEAGINDSPSFTLWILDWKLRNMTKVFCRYQTPNVHVIQEWG